MNCNAANGGLFFPYVKRDSKLSIIDGSLTSVSKFMVPQAVKAWPMPSVYHVRLPAVSPRELWGAGAAVARAARAVRIVAVRNIVNSVCLRWDWIEIFFSFVFQMRVSMAQFRGLKSDLIKKEGSLVDDSDRWSE